MKTNFYHVRNVGRKNKEHVTVCYIPDTMQDKDGKEHKIIYVGVARCSHKDQFVKAKGRMIAEGRAKRAQENIKRGVFARISKDSPYPDAFATEVDSFVKKDIIPMLTDAFSIGK